MGFTALGAQLPAQQKAWVKESIRVFRENFFFEKFLGTSDNSIVQTVNELKRTAQGDRAMVGLVQEMRGSGIVGDNDINGRREALESSWIEIHTDQLRNGVTSKGRVDDQRSVFSFRKEARDKLAYWRAKITEDLMILTASGIAYNYNTDGSLRVIGAQDDPRTLEFAADVVAPSTNRHFNFNGTSLVAGDTTTIANTFLPKYGMIVDLAAEARTRGIKPIVIGGQEYYVYLCHPKHFARLKKDSDFRTAVLTAAPRSDKHPIFTGATVTMDGLIIHTNTRVFNTSGGTSGASSGGKWGSGYAVDGTRSLLMGCQALLHADLWGAAQWFEGKEDDDAKNVISIAMYFGMRKPQYASRFDADAVEDFGVMAVNTYL